MIDPRVLDHLGTSNSQLRTFFTGDSEQKTKFCENIRGLIHEGRIHCTKIFRHLALWDFMWDGQIVPENVPLVAYAQGKIDLKTCEAELGKLGCADKFIEQQKVKDEATGQEQVKPVLNFPRLYEVCVNIGRSLVSRRVDAQSNKYGSLRPFMKYEPRSTSMVAHLRGEATSQYAEVMSDAYGYRHVHTQLIRDMLGYGYNVLFPAGAWDSDTQIEVAPEDFDGETIAADLAETIIADAEGRKPKLRSVIVREGVKMVWHHPGRIIADTAHPLATLNTDTGCRYVGFQDVKRYGDIADNPDFYNVDKITWNIGGGSILDQNRPYFDLVFQGQPLNFPKAQAANAGVFDAASTNDRVTQRYVYSQADADRSVFVTDLRIKVVPKDWGMGGYPHPVWLRLVVAGDETVLYAEWLPSLPAIYWGHNANDNRLLNNGQSHEIAPMQDQLSNIFSQLLMKMKHSLLRVILINSDVVPEDIRKKLRDALDSPKYYINPHLIEVSFKDLGEKLGMDLDKVFKVSSGNSGADSEYINNAFKAIIQILSILERLLNLSPQEQGQPSPRETTAQEIAVIESTTQVKYNAISASIDEARAAWKRIIYESSMAFASDEIYLPVSQRFTEATIKAAGFELEREETEEAANTAAKRGHTIIGTKRKLVHDYIFSSRDGGDRATNRESANVLVSLLGQVVPLIGPEAIGKKRIFEIVNEVFRLLASYDLRLEMNEGESDTMMAPQTAQVLQRMQTVLQEHQQEIGGLGDALQKLDEILKSLPQLIQQEVNKTQAPQPLAPAM